MPGIDEAENGVYCGTARLVLVHSYPRVSH